MEIGCNILANFGINGSLRRVETHSPEHNMEHYLFNSAANFKAYSNNGLDFAYYGYNASNTRTYKLTMTNANQWVNGQPGPLRLQLQSAMLHPNAYINFNQNGEYTKHYYSGTERICSRLGDAYVPMTASADSRTWVRRLRADALFRSQIGELMSGEEPDFRSDRSGGGTRELVSPDVEYSPVTTLTALMPTGNPDDIFYYHTNHLGSTAFVTDQNRNVTQGFLYAPFGEITTEYAPSWQNGTLPKYSFNAKELDEETGMYYYEARYYKPPVFTSRDPMFEKYFWMTPYAYCANNPVKYVDPSGKEPVDPRTGKQLKIKFYNAAVYEYNDDIGTRKSFDEKLYKHNTNNIKWKESNRMRSKLDGIWEGADPFPLKKSLHYLDNASKKLLESFFPNNEDVTSNYVQGKCYYWQEVAKIGEYSYVDDIYYRGSKHFNIISVKDNIVNQIIHFEKKDGLFEIESVTSFESKKVGDKIIVKESVQHYKNGLPYGELQLKNYETTVEN